MTHQTEERLSQYLDGELAEADRAEVEAWLSSSDEGRAFVRELEAVGDAVRSVAAERNKTAPDLTDSILARIERDASAEAPVRASPSPMLQAGAPMGSRVRWLRLAPPVGLALAAAAAVALLLRPAKDGAGHGGESARAVATEARRVVEPGPAADLSPVESESGASIESVDFGAHNGTIFMVAGGADVTPVVWLVDEPEPSGDRMTPL